MEIKEQTEPTAPRPPTAEIDRVYHDLATVLSDAGQDADGRRAVGRDALRERLKSAGHSLAAIDWAVYLFCEDELLRTTSLKEKQVRTIRPGVSEAKARMIDVPAVAATEEFWERWKTGALAVRQKEVILLVHGIRTFAGWQPMVRRVLEQIPNTKVIPIKYGYLDAFRFWFPFFTRQVAINELRREIQNTREANPDAQVSVIAHSFGTYAISKILVENPDIRLHRLILSGAIIPRSYRWDYVRSRLATEVLNDYGTRDIWPVLAKCLSWGYGDTGRHGFGRIGVMDRGHDYAHSDFFNEKFIREYWKPWFENGQVVPSPWEETAPPPSWLLSILSVLPLQWILCAIILTTVLWFGRNAVLHGNGTQPHPSPVGSQQPPMEDKLAVLALHQELSKLRDVLSQPLRQDRLPLEKYPDADESGKLAKWNEPRKSSINQIAMLAETDSKTVVRALIPLLSDSDGVVVAGALCALHDIILQHPKEADGIRDQLPKGHKNKVNLRDSYIVDQDFSAFAGTELFYGAQFQGAVLEKVKMDGLVLKLAEFGRSTILQCSFTNADLERSSWRDSRVRSTDFESANMFSIFAHSADFGTATSDPTMLFPGNRFSKTILNDADLNRASMVGAQLEGAKLNSAQFIGADFTDAYMDDGLVSEQLLRGAGVVLLNEETKYGRGQRP